MQKNKRFCLPKGYCTNEDIDGPRKVVYKKQHCVDKFRALRDFELGVKDKKKSSVSHCDVVLKELSMKKEISHKRHAKKTILPPHEINRIKSICNQNPALAKQSLLEEEEKKKKMLDLSAKLIQHFRQIDQAKLLANQTEGDEIKKEKAKEKFKTLDRAFIAKHEQEEEVRMMTRSIGNAKCKAYIDAQVMAKKIHEEKSLAEKKKYENILLEVDKKKVEELDDKKAQAKMRRLKYAVDVKNQIKENERLRFLEGERYDLEVKGFKKAHEEYLLKVEKDKQKEAERRQKFRAECDEIIELKKIFKKIGAQQEIVEEKIREEIKKAKCEKEKELVAEKKALMKAYMEKQEAIFHLGSKKKDAEDHRYEMYLLLQREQFERDYRRKELEAAKRKKQVLAELALLRKEERDKKLQKKALAIAFMEQEFNALLKKVKHEEELEMERQRKRRERNDGYRQDLIQQINRKENDRRQMELRKRNEAFEARDNERQRNENIKAVIQTKIEAMRQACLPEKYIQEIEMQFAKLREKRKLN